MKQLTIILSFLLLSIIAFTQVQVKGYTKKNGTYVAPHTRSEPNKTTNDNYSTRGNTNPQTGKTGTTSPTYNPSPQNSNRTIQTGSRGGQYYINSNGNKTYIKK